MVGSRRGDRGLSVRAAFWAALRRRCPACGLGRAFDTWWHMRPECPVCGREFHRHPGSTTGVMQIGSLAITLFGFASFAVLYLLAGWPMERAIAGMAVLTTTFGLIAHPYAKLLWEAADVVMDRMEGDAEQ
jgi:uncharacterized protein (DUF983 family)